MCRVSAALDVLGVELIPQGGPVELFLIPACAPQLVQ